MNYWKVPVRGSGRGGALADREPSRIGKKCQSWWRPQPRRHRAAPVATADPQRRGRSRNPVPVRNPLPPHFTARWPGRKSCFLFAGIASRTKPRERSTHACYPRLPETNAEPPAPSDLDAPAIRPNSIMVRSDSSMTSENLEQLPQTLRARPEEHSNDRHTRLARAMGRASEIVAASGLEVGSRQCAAAEDSNKALRSFGESARAARAVQKPRARSIFSSRRAVNARCRAESTRRASPWSQVSAGARNFLRANFRAGDRPRPHRSAAASRIAAMVGCG